jgi:hypothetical protein
MPVTDALPQTHRALTPLRSQARHPPRSTPSRGRRAWFRRVLTQPLAKGPTSTPSQGSSGCCAICRHALYMRT